MTVVGIDVSAIPDEPRGAGRYVMELVRALGTRGEVALRLETRRNDAGRWAALVANASVHPVVPDSRLRRLAWEQIAAPRFVDHWGIDVFHGPHYTMPEIAKLPKVVTIHDLTFFDHPEWHEKVKVSFFTRAIRVAAKRADALVCVSEPTARRLRELLDPHAPVYVIPHGIDHARFRRDDPSGRDEELLAGLGVPLEQRLVAFAATIEPRKDLATLIRAFDVVASTLDDVTLVIGGGSGWGMEPVDRALAASKHRDRILRLGYLPDDAVPALMRRSAVFVYAAFEEGFGLPVLEALACGAPTVTAEGSVMEELADGAAFTTPPGDVRAMASVLLDVLSRASGEAARTSLGLEVAARYTWDEAARAHEAVYRSLEKRY